MNDRGDRHLPTGETSTAKPDSHDKRKAYEKPQVVYRAPLEAMAAVCAPRNVAKGNPGLCPQGPISS
jgi:hypothetical protein